MLRLLVFGYGVRKLVGAGGAVAADNAFQDSFNLVYISAFAKFCHALRVAAAAAMELNAAQFVLFVHFK